MIGDAPFLIGFDGGGTSCRAALVAEGRRYDVTLGPANVSTDFDAALATIRDALSALAEKAGVAPSALADAPAHLGLAGVISPTIAARVTAALPLGRAVVTDDRPTTIAGALGDDDGAVAAIGTGSFIGRQTGGRVTGIGGWGFRLGDQASGAWLARRCLEEVMLAVDGIGPETDLTRRILTEHGDDPGRIVHFSLSARPEDYARMAREIVAAAEAGDALGVRLMTEGADYILAGLAALGWRPGEALCLAGGHGPAYAHWLGEPVTAAKGSALDGALLLAARAAEAGR
ncbi:BadF/BadG/BcrA/BcrD ATPase family protein [Defluviimonas sp. SAOS-178_SWC]|uniref:BadF/BadG/BcrA/BcrD ATPase family protein n=1 Tax=Defluviimonas sp. SAOS-178_SWC TaxID=3121287 RepID=UPI0032217A9B